MLLLLLNPFKLSKKISACVSYLATQLICIVFFCLFGVVACDVAVLVVLATNVNLEVEALLDVHVVGVVCMNGTEREEFILFILSCFLIVLSTMNCFV